MKGKVRQELRKYMSKGEMLGIKGKNVISIPIPQINLPTFRYADKKAQGVGQGDGEVGQPIARGEEAGTGEGAGNLPGSHILEVDFTIEELAEIMGEELGLPNIEPRGKRNITSVKERYTGIHTSGPDSLTHFKRTYKTSLKRLIAAGEYDFKDPRVVPIRQDKRYRSWKLKQEEDSNAVIIYMMDVSGSMGDEQKEIVRAETFWIDAWLRSQYRGIESRYIIHDAVAHEVTRDVFFSTRESGGTIISSAYELCVKLIEKDFSPTEWNIYPFHFSDGDNWSGDDTQKCFEILKTKILPSSNMFCYGQVESLYGSGQFFRDLNEAFKDNEAIVTSRIPNKEAIYDSIKTFLGKGK